MRGDLLGGLAHIIMAAVKSHRPSVSWRPQDASNVAQFRSKVHRAGVVDGVALIPRLKVREPGGCWSKS